MHRVDKTKPNQTTCTGILRMHSWRMEVEEGVQSDATICDVVGRFGGQRHVVRLKKKGVSDSTSTSPSRSTGRTTRGRYGGRRRVQPPSPTRGDRRGRVSVSVGSFWKTK